MLIIQGLGNYLCAAKMRAMQFLKGLIAQGLGCCHFIIIAKGRKNATPAAAATR
jgi:hypothetical protein